MSDTSIGFDGDTDANDNSPPPVQPTKTPKPAASRKSKPQKQARPAAAVTCERCSTDDRAVVCEPDPDRPGWVSCPNRCGFRHKPLTALHAHRARRQALHAAQNRSAR